jgi:hypothetical protein
MSDRSSDPSAADANDSADDGEFEPGGGPQRVVSEESVDDILDSLNDSNPGSSSPAATITTEADAEPEREREDTRTDPDAERDPGEEGRAVADDPVEGATNEDGPTDGSSDPAANGESNDSTTDDSDASPAATEPTDPAGGSAVEAEPSATVDDAVSSLPDEADEATGESLEELAARVERGTVTGADVRAAEAGDGREKTPAIDEIELGVDDLERPDATIGSDPASDDGPFAGSIGPDSEVNEGSSTSDSDERSDEERSGLLGRLIGLFS